MSESYQIAVLVVAASIAPCVLLSMYLYSRQRRGGEL